MKNNMELSVWGDGTTCLASWENLNGHDVIYVLREDGVVTVDGNPVDFVAELRKLANKIAPFT